jgi:mannosyltransferase
MGSSTVRTVVNPQVILTNFNSRFTGVSATIANLAERHEQRFDVVILGKPLPVSTPQMGRWQLPRFLWGRATRPVRIWHARRNSEMLLGLLAKHLLRMPLKLVFTTVALRRHSALPRLLLSSMDAIIATTEEAASFVDHCDVIVPHGIDTSCFTPPENKQQCWKQSGLPGKYGIGIFGRVRSEKGTDLFVEAMCRVLPHYPDFTAVIAGHCKGKDQRFKKLLEKKLAAADIKDRVLWLGEVSAEERHLWFQRICLCVAPPRYEGFGLTPVEAMSCGAAVIATRTGIFPTLIEEGKTGYVVEVGDLGGLCEALERCLANPEGTLQMGCEGRQHVQDNYDIRQEAEGIEAVYRKILSSHH